MGMSKYPVLPGKALPGQHNTSCSKDFELGIKNVATWNQSVGGLDENHIWKGQGRGACKENPGVRISGLAYA